MKTNLLVLVVILVVLLQHQSNATIWRVNNRGYSAHFSSLTSAHNSNQVAPGDTIHLEGSEISYDGIVLTKRLVIIGAGYFLGENPNSSASLLSTKIKTLTFNEGSAGSQLIGVHVEGDGYIYCMVARVGNLLIKRCKIDKAFQFNLRNLVDIKIVQSILGESLSNEHSFIALGSLSFNTLPSGFVLQNNIFLSGVILGDDHIFSDVSNNTFDIPAIANQPSLRFGAATFQNNLIMNPNAVVKINGGGNFSGISNNLVASSIQLPNSSNLVVVPEIPTLFLDLAGVSRDGRYILKEGSAASGKGTNGTDIGAFGGPDGNKYTLSGKAPIPLIYQVDTDGIAGPTGLNVSIKARVVK